jgi:hypothetical protein
MQTRSTHYSPATGWVRPLPVELDGQRTLVLAFGPSSLLDDPRCLREVADAFGQSVLVGCSTAGQICGDSIDDERLDVVVARFDSTGLQLAATPLNDAADSHAAGVRLASQLPQQDLRTVFILSGGIRVNGAALAEGIGSALPAGVTVSGGLAADGSLFKRTWVCHEGAPREEVVTAVGFYGPAVRVGHGCRGGWTEFGPERRVTRAEGNVLLELDDQPALQLYKHYLGERASDLPGSGLLFPLAVRRGGDASTTVVRTILAVDDDANSMTFAGDIPEGAAVRLMRTSIDRLIASADEAGIQALGGGVGKASDVLAISISCIGRRLVMGEQTEDEVEAIVERLPAGALHAGFYSYGEISASSQSGMPELHNQTMTLTVLSEE